MGLPIELTILKEVFSYYKWLSEYITVILFTNGPFLKN